MTPTQWRTELEKHETLHTGNCYCDEDARCNSKERLVAFITSLLSAIKDEVGKEKLPEKLGTYGKYDQLHIQSNIGFNSALTKVEDIISKAIEG